MFLKQNQYSIELLSISDLDNHTALLRGGGKGQVPCLRIESADGTIEWLYESDDIIDYLRSQ